MEENENKRNTRIFYLTLAVVMTVVIVLVIATSVARRSNPDENMTDTSGNSQLGSDTNTGTNDTNSDTLPTFLLPLEGEISMDYSDSVPVFSQTMNDYRTHSGIDSGAELGQEVIAVADGVVTNVWDDPFMGTCISIEHSGNAVSIYKNLDPVVYDGIVIGSSVKAGDIIGAVGESAPNEIAEEPHLHYELKIGDKHVDPKEHLKFPTKDTESDNKTEENTDSKQ